MNIAVCFSVIGTQTKVPRSMQAAQRDKQACSEIEKKYHKLYLFKRADQYSGQEISLKIEGVSTGWFRG